MAHFAKTVRNIVFAVVLAGAALAAYTYYTGEDGISDGISGAIKTAEEYADDYLSKSAYVTADPDYSPEADEMFNEKYDIVSGDIDKCAIEDIKSGMGMDIDVGGCALKLVTSDDADALYDGLYIEASGIEKYQCYTENDTLFIKGSSTDSGTKSQIILYIPKGFVFAAADIELGAGSVEIESIKADELRLECGAGRINAEYAEADNISLKCSAGSINVRLFGVKEDYNFILENAIGMVDIGGESYNGVAQYQKIQNDADKNVSVNCSLGSIKIEF
jgi:hypothetical protein